VITISYFPPATGTKCQNISRSTAYTQYTAATTTSKHYLNNPSNPAGAVVRDNFSYPETWHTPDDYGHCDVLMTHDVPQAVINYEREKLLPPELNSVDMKSYRNVFDLIAELLSPKLYLCGHAHPTDITATRVKNFDMYSNTKDVPVIKNIFTRDNRYAAIAPDRNAIEVREWSGESENITI